MTRFAMCALMVCGLAASPSFAQDLELQRQVQKLEAQVATLQTELARLQTQVVLRSGGALALISKGVREDTTADAYRLVVGGDWNAKATRTVVIDSGQGILLRSGKASIELKPSGQVIIKGSVVDITATDVIEVKATNDVNIKGTKIGGN